VENAWQAMIFVDRSDAGRQLASKLSAYAGPDTRVLALPRGGVPVAYEVAIALNAPLDVFIVRKLGVPGQEELAMGAIASGDVRVLNQETIAALGIEDELIDAVIERERSELERRQNAYRDDLPAHDVAGKDVIVVDDGIATGASMYAGVLALRQREPRTIAIAVPVAPPETRAVLAREVDAFVCIATPEPFRGVGAWYADFKQIDDEGVRALLKAAFHREADAQR